MLRLSLIVAWTACAVVAQSGGPRKNAVAFPARQQFQTQWPEQAGTAQAHGIIMTSTATSTRWITVQFRTVAEPPLAAPGAFAGNITRVGNTLHRLLLDRNSQSYIGYDLIVSGDAANGYQAVFRPLSNAEELLRAFAPNLILKPVPQPKYPEAQKVRQDEAIALDVMVSADGKQRVVDYLKFSPARSPDLPPAAGTADARDMTVDDEPLNLSLESVALSSVLMGGEKFAGPVGFVNGNGGTPWVALPGYGRYILSLAPHAGFTLAGTIREHVIAFRDGAKQFEIRLGNPIVAADHAWNLYVYHDAGFVPQKAKDAVIVGKGRLEHLLNNRTE